MAYVAVWLFAAVLVLPANADTKRPFERDVPRIDLSGHAKVTCTELQYIQAGITENHGDSRSGT